MHYTLELDTSNAAFEEHPAQEVATILESLARKIAALDYLPEPGEALQVRDHNGNTVGYLQPSE